MSKAMQQTLFTLLLAPLLLLGCATNPVTGDRELSFVSEEQELQIGEQNYVPAQQSQGGQLTIDPGLTEYVQRVGQRIAAVSDRELPYEFVVLNNSTPNAWAMPGGKIAINRGLLTALDNEAELASVLGHEIVHAAARHGAQAQTRSMVLTGALIAGAIASSDSEYSNLLIGGAQVGAQLINQRYGREAERESDYYGTEYMVEAGYDPHATVTLMEKFVALSEGRDQSWLNGLFSSHPPSRERVENARELVAQMDLSGRNLELGEARYAEQMQFLREAQPAYALFDEAHEAIAADDLELAMDKLEQANDILPQEARFDGLRADILLSQRRYREAIRTYNTALDKNDGYFDYYLGRGIANNRLGNRSQARVDLERSIELLPTAPAALELGNMAMAENDRATAKQYYQAAAQAGGNIGQQASLAFIRLDIQDNPGNYLQVQAGSDNNGQLVAQVTNTTPLNIDNVQVEFRVAAGGRIQSLTRTTGSIGAGNTVLVGSGARVPPASSDGFDARVIAAVPR